LTPPGKPGRMVFAQCDKNHMQWLKKQGAEYASFFPMKKTLLRNSQSI